MGKTPFTRGMPKSCMGTAARSEMMRVSTSSLTSSSPICRFPMSRSPTIRIGRDAEYPTAFVQQRFEQITSSHIEKVLDGISENTTRVWNTKAYLLAALFNAPSSTDNHYTMLVNHDFHHDYGG